jgi:hypothetical protein
VVVGVDRGVDIGVVAGTVGAEQAGCRVDGEAAAVALAFSWRTQDGLEAAEIARRLNAARYPRPVNPRTRLEVAWTGQRVLAMLADPVYSGRSVWGRTRDERPVPVTLWVLSARRECLAIVSDEQFLDAQYDRHHRLALATRFASNMSAGSGSTMDGTARRQV